MFLGFQLLWVPIEQSDDKLGFELDQELANCEPAQKGAQNSKNRPKVLPIFEENFLNRLEKPAPR